MGRVVWIAVRVGVSRGAGSRRDGRACLLPWQVLSRREDRGWSPRAALSRGIKGGGLSRLPCAPASLARDLAALRASRLVASRGADDRFLGTRVGGDLLFSRMP